jgi:hypothetical protein
MADFPDNPALNDKVVHNNVTYTFNGQAWDGVAPTPVVSSVNPSFITIQADVSSGISSARTTANNPGTVTVNLDDTGVTAGNYNTADITVDAQGRVSKARSRTEMKSIYSVYDGDWAAAFNVAGENGGAWWIPSGTYDIDRQIIIRENGTKFIGDESDKPKLRFNFTGGLAQANGITSNNGFGLWAAAKFRVRGVAFQWKQAVIPQNINAALLLFQKGDTGDNSSRADMDSSIENCNFTAARHNFNCLGAAYITYYGRNMRVTDCTFSSKGNRVDGADHIRAIALSYAPNADDDDDGQTLATGGHRKNYVSGNTFHMTSKSICVEAFMTSNVGVGVLAGLMITSNMNDIGGTLLRVNEGVYADSTVITGNSCIRSKKTPYVEVLSGGRLRNSTITGNSFGNIDARDDNYADGITLHEGGQMRDVTITGNAFGAPQNACIKLDGTYARVVITGNIFDKLHGPGNVAVAAGSADNKAVLVANSTDNLTLTSGTTGKWQIANNIV